MANYKNFIFHWFGDYIADDFLSAINKLNHLKLDSKTRRLFVSDGLNWRQVANGVGYDESYGNVELRSSGLLGEGHFNGIQQQGTFISSDNDSSGYWARIQAAASAGSLAGFTHSVNNLASVRRTFDGWMSMKYQGFATDMPLSGHRFILGLWDQTGVPPDSDTLLADARSGFFIVNRAGVDTNYVILHNDGTGSMQTVDTTIPFPTSSTIQRLEIQWHPTDGFRWVIENFGGTILAKGIVNTRIPATSTKCYMVGGIMGNAKNILLRHIRCKVGGH